MNCSHSYTDDQVSSMSSVPQHLLLVDDNSTRQQTMISRSATRMRRRRPASSIAKIAIPLIVASAMPLHSHGYSTLTQSTSSLSFTPSSKSLVDQARIIRERKNHKSDELMNEEEGNSRLPTNLLFDNGALSVADLFDDDFTNSLDSAVANLKKQSSSSAPTSSSAKSRAEEFDRFMEEDSNIASMVHDTIKPGSLVNDVQNSKGADIDIVDNNMEILLQREAADRRMRRDRLKRAKVVRAGVRPRSDDVKVGRKNDDIQSTSPSSLIKVTRKSKLTSTPRTKPISPLESSNSSNKSYNKDLLLTREQEYALANTIQSGTHVHKLKAEYESKHSQPLSKKEWAALVDMSPNELRKLISDYRSAKQELVSSNMGLVHAVVNNVYKRKANLKGVQLDELIQEGSLGLIRAAELFDPAKGLRFSTYATIWIKGVLSNSNSLDEVITLPNREKALGNKIRAAWEEMSLEGGGGDNAKKNGVDGGTSSSSRPSVSNAKELAKRLNMKESLVRAHLRRMACVSNVLSLDYQYTASTRSGYSTSNKQESLHNSIEMGTDADLAEQLQFKADVVSEMVRNLSEREVTLMRLRYGLNEDGVEHTVRECADIMGINRETARLLQHKCLKKLREASSMESLQEYLLTVA